MPTPSHRSRSAATRKPTPAGLSGRDALLASALIGAALAALFGYGWCRSRGDIFGGPAGDLNIIFYYWRAFAKTTISAGSFPFWNPYTFCGAPFAANPETALFYPPTWLFLLLPVPVAYNLNILAHLALGGLSAWALARRLDCDRLPALLAGLVYLLCAPILVRVESGQLSNICTVAWIPLLFLCVEEVLAGAGWLALPAGALAYGMMCLAGHLQYAYFTSMFIAVHVGLRLTVFRSNDTVAAPGVLARLSGLVCAGLALAAIQLAMTACMAREIGRIHPTPSFSGMCSLAPEALITFLLPRYFGSMLPLRYWGPCNIQESTAYVGVLPLVLFGCVLPNLLRGTVPAGAARQLAIARALLIGAGLFLVIALGRHTPLFIPIFEYVPGMALFRCWDKFLVHVSLALALIGAFGLQWLLAESTERPLTSVTRVVISVAVLMGVVLLLMRWTFVDDAAACRRMIQEFTVARDSAGSRTFTSAPGFLSGALENIVYESLRTAVLLVLDGALLAGLLASARLRDRLLWALLALLFLDVAGAFTHLIRRVDSASFQVPPALRSVDPARARLGRIYFQPYLFQNVALLAGVRSPFGPEAAAPWGLGKLWNAAVDRDYDEVAMPDAFFGRAASQEKIGQLLGIGWIYSYDRLTPVPDAVPRLALYEHASLLPGVRDVWERIAAGRFDPHRELLLSRDEVGDAPSLVDAPGGGTLVPEAPGSATFTTDEPELTIVRTHLLRPAWLYLSDTCAGGWSATVDGQVVPIYRAYCAFRAVRLPAGDHVVVFRYAAPGFVAGVFVTTCAWVMLGAAIPWARPRFR